MKLLFWNLYNKENSKHVAAILSEYKVDVAIFCEYKNLNTEKVLLNSEYQIEKGNGGNEKIIAFYRKSNTVRIRREQPRYSLYEVHIQDRTIILIGTHLQANPYASESARNATLEDLRRDIDDLEKELGILKTVVIGDFNANPFSGEMINKRGLNAVLFKELINKKDVITYENKKYKRFYNPMLMVLSEEDKSYGSIYYDSGIESLYWNLYDQVLVRKELINSINEIQYIKTTDNTSLITKEGHPNKRISDHFPLFVEVEV